MTTPLALLLAGGLAVCPPASAAGSLPGPAGAAFASLSPADRGGSPELEALYRSGVPFRDFLAAADRRRDMWKAHYEEGSLDGDLIERAAALGGTRRILAIAEDWCSDSVNTIPFLALLAEGAENLELRIVGSAAGREVMEAHRTPDGRAATPTVLLLDGDYEPVGCWIERPSDLQAWALERRPELDDRTFLARKMAWYAQDAGRSTVREVVELMEDPDRGRASCRDG